MATMPLLLQQVTVTSLFIFLRGDHVALWVFLLFLLVLVLILFLFFLFFEAGPHLIALASLETTV